MPLLAKTLPAPMALLAVLLLTACAPEPARLLIDTEPEEGAVTLVIRVADLSGRPAHPPDAGPVMVRVEGPLRLSGKGWAEFSPQGVARVRLIETGTGRARVEVRAGDLPGVGLDLEVGLSGGTVEAVRGTLPLQSAHPRG